MNEFLTKTKILPPYLAFPRFLLDVNINETAKLLYALLLDRARLSQQNDGWTDENGHVYLYYTIADMAVALHKSEMTIKTALNALTDKGLLTRKRQGIGKPNRIYVKIPVVMDRNTSVSKAESCLTEGKKAVCQGAGKLSTNNKEISNTKRKKQESNARVAFGSYKNVFLTEQELSALQAEEPNWAERIERLSSYMASSGKTYHNHAATIRQWALKDKCTAVGVKRNYECKEGESL